MIGPDHVDKRCEFRILSANCYMYHDDVDPGSH